MARKSLPPATEVVRESEPPPSKSMRVQMASFVSPFPPAAILAEYDDRMPGTAERIMKNFEAETSHRHKHDDDNGAVHRDFIRAQIFATKLGAVTTAVVGVGGIVATIILSASGNAHSAAMVGGAEFVSAAVFAFIRRQKTPLLPKAPTTTE